MEKSHRTISVTILGKEYHLAGDDPEYVRQLAAYVDEKLRELSAHAPHLPATHLAILTAINLADELYKAQNARRNADVDAVRARLHSLIRLLGSSSH